MQEKIENKMGTMPVKKLLVTMSLPLMISMLVQAMYNIVDSIFITQISEKAFTAVSLAFPMQMLMIAVAVGIGVGVNSLLSRRLGEKKQEDANMAATNGFFLALIGYLVFAIFGLFFSKMFIGAFTEDPDVIKMGGDYLSICCVFSFGVFGQIIAERVMQATGITIYNMITQGAGAIINIVLDPIFIFVFDMGVAGAAIATVIGQTAAMGLGFFFNFKKNHLVKISFKKFRPNKRIIGDILRVGFPSIIMQSIGSFMTIGVNAILMGFSEMAVNVFGAYFKIQSFIFMPVFGLANALIAIVGFNFGARNKKRIHDTLKFAVILSVAMMLVGMILFLVLPRQLLLMFNASEEMLRVGIPALRIISICFISAGVSISLSSVFQAVGNGMLSLIISFIRQLIVVLPVTYLLARFAGLESCWWSFPIAEGISLLISIAMFLYVKKKYFARLDLPETSDEKVLQLTDERGEADGTYAGAESSGEMFDVIAEQPIGKEHCAEVLVVGAGAANEQSAADRTDGK